MEITEVRVNLQDEPVLKAFVSITLDDQFVVRGLKVIEGQDGRFVAMPARKKRDGTFQDIAHPITRATRERLEQVVLEAYDEENGAEGGGVHAPLDPDPPTLVGRAARVVKVDREPTWLRSDDVPETGRDDDGSGIAGQRR